MTVPAFVAPGRRQFAPVRGTAPRAVFSAVSGSNPAQAVSEDHGIDPAPASIVMPKEGNAMRRRKAGEGMRKIMQEMISVRA